MPTRDERVQILVVDDNEDGAELFTIVLGHFGYAVHSCATAEEALTWVREHRPALVMTDISLPGMSGLELARELHRLEALADVPVVAVSAHRDTSWPERVRAAGCAAFVVRPITPTALAACVRDQLAAGAMALDVGGGA